MSKLTFIQSLVIFDTACKMDELKIILKILDVSHECAAAGRICRIIPGDSEVSGRGDF